MRIFLVFLLFVLSSCDYAKEKAAFPYHWQAINSRDEGESAERKPLYQAKVPATWIRQDPSSTESIADTTKPLCEFYMEGKAIHLTVHNFPKQRIPPMAQVNRWCQQFEELDPARTSISAVSQAGFAGLQLEAEGLFKGQPTRMLGWSMQLAPEFYQVLDQTQKKADYTIKVIGPPDLVRQQETAINFFTNSFELIDELPSP